MIANEQKIIEEIARVILETADWRVGYIEQILDDKDRLTSILIFDPFTNEHFHNLPGQPLETSLAEHRKQFFKKGPNE